MVFVLAATAISRPAWAQTQGNVLLESNEQIFCVLAALNAAGYDTGLGASAGDDTRAQVREFLEAKKAPVVEQLAKFYSQHRVEGDPGADLGQYLSLALLLSPPPDFNFTVPQGELPPDARDLVGLVPLLRTFYTQAGLLQLWAKVQPRYDAAVERYTDSVRRALVVSDAYFRFSTAGYLGRTYAVYIDLMGVPEQVQARIYGMNYYLVVTPSRQPKIDEIRHQYLHFLLDPLAAKYAGEINQKVALSAISREAPTLSLDFKDDFPLLVTECLIRATELRLDKRPAAEAEKSLTEMTAAGLILVRHFYEALGDFERQDASMTVYYKPMIEGIDTRAEQKRLFGVHFAPRPPAPVAKVSPARSELDRLLDEGDNQFFQAKYPEAKAAYQQVLEKIDPKNERALYGMAVSYANMRKPDLAEEYFKKTLATARDVRLVTWSHIYLGRLADLQGKREDAVAQYRAASLTAAAYPLAIRAVESGMAAPFGAKPH